MHWEAEVKWTRRCNWRLWSSDVEDALHGHGPVYSVMQLDPGIDSMCIWTWSPRSNALGAAIGGCDHATLDQTSRLRCSDLRHPLEGFNIASVELHSEALLDRDYRRTWRQSSGRQFIRNQSIWRWWIGMEVWCELWCYSLGKPELWECSELSTTRFPKRWEMRLAESGRHSILKQCITKSILYSGLTDEHGIERKSMITSHGVHRWW